ncbi:MAG: electron transfer flavoprotein subunit beta/FixA family protein [Thermoplasmatota archaeon]
MKLVVCVKQVPDTTEVRIDPKTNTLVREGVESILNPYDQFALEEALRLKEANENVHVTVLSMGPPQARRVLLKSLALGADGAVLLSDRAFAGSDTWATSVALSHAVKEIGDVDIVFCGLQAIDGDTAQVGPEMAQLLDIPQITYAEKVTLTYDGRVQAEQQTEDGSRILESRTPVLVTCLPPPSFVPKVAPLPGLMKAREKPYEVWDHKRVKAGEDDIGLTGSPTQVRRTYSPPARGEVQMLKGDVKEMTRQLAAVLVDRKVVGGGR